MERINENEVIKCRYCSSSNIRVNNKGISLGQAAFGFLTWGVLGGIVGGLYKSKELEFTCLSCGYKWYPFDPTYQPIYEKQDNERRKEEEKRIQQEQTIISPEQQRINKAMEINQQIISAYDNRQLQNNPTPTTTNSKNKRRNGAARRSY